MIGTIRFWKKRWGFIAARGYPFGVFLHRAQILAGEPEEGRRVRFSVTVVEKGPKATEAVVLTDEEARDGDGL